MWVRVCKIPVLITTEKKGEQIVPFWVSAAAGRPGMFHHYLSEHRKKNKPILNGKPKDCRKRLDAMEEREGAGGHGSCRGFRCARPKIRREMRREDEKKRTICQDWSETPQSHKPGMTKGEIRGKRGLQRTEGSEIGWEESGKCKVLKVSGCNFSGLAGEPKDTLFVIKRCLSSFFERRMKIFFSSVTVHTIILSYWIYFSGL